MMVNGKMIKKKRKVIYYDKNRDKYDCELKNDYVLFNLFIYKIIILLVKKYSIIFPYILNINYFLFIIFILNYFSLILFLFFKCLVYLKINYFFK